jgi:hypothetical protein
MKPTFIIAVSFAIASLTFAHTDGPPSIFIEGYTGQVSYAQGEEVGFHISTTAAKFSMEIARIGAERKIVWSKQDLPGKEQPVPEDASANGCRWPEAVRVPSTREWPSGYYEATLKCADSGGKWTHRGARTAQSTVWFVVRSAEPGTKSKVLLQLCTNTYDAYNNWGGFSLYAYNGLSNNQGHKVSFDRPGGSQFARWELPFVEWAERNGYALEFAANSDLEFRPEILSSYKLVLSVGHDEYWSGPMRDNLEGFIAKGGNVAFFSGNTCCWQVRSEDGGRALTCWKENFSKDPVWQEKDRSSLATLWSHHLLKRPENQMTGVGFLWGGYQLSHGQFMDGPGAYTVYRPDHWILEGTGLKKGDMFGGKDTIVGYECDGCEIEMKDGLPVPTHRDGTPEGFTIIGMCPAKWHPDDSAWYEKWEMGRVGQSVLGTYTKPGGGTVFTTGSTDWSHGLKGKDPVVERVTKNILKKLGS